MSINKTEIASAPQGSNNNAVSSADIDPSDPQHGAKVTSLTEMVSNAGKAFTAMAIELTSTELKGKTLNSYADRIQGHDQLKTGSKIVVNLGLNNNGYPDIVGGKRKSYLVKA
jgi:hypothetical protein